MKLLRAGIALLLVCVFFGCSFGTDIDTLREKAGGSKSYTVTFNSNGGSEVPAQTVAKGAKATEPQGATHAGHTLNGWYKEAALTNRWNFAADTVTANITLYAKWNANPPNTFTVTFNGNGGSNVPDQAVTVGETANCPANPTQNGYTFDNWYCDTELTTVYNFSTPVMGNIILYAKWNPIAYTIAYDKNAVDATGTMTNSSHTYDIEKNLNANAFTRNGYTFTGWAETPDGTVEFTNGQSVKNLTDVAGATVTLYAKWNPITYYVAYNANGGTGTMTNSSHTYDVEKALNLNAFARNGYSLFGWTRTADGTVEFTNGQGVKNLTDAAGETVTLYAVWVDASTVWTVKFETNGGSPVGDAVVLKINPAVSRPAPDPTRTGYTFDNWYSGSDFKSGSLWNFGSVVTENTTLYAKWNPITYTVAYNANGGTGTMTNSSHTYDVDKNLNANVFTRTGYTFDGWSKTSTGAVEFTNGQSVKNLTVTAGGIVTLYAKWYSTVTFNANGATGGTAPASQTANAGSSITLPSGDGLSRTGYTFGGWNTNEYGTGTNRNADSPYTPEGDITLYARWYSTVTFNANGATGGTAPASQTANAGSSITLPAVGNLTRAGYTFGGWNINEYGTGTNYNAGVPYTPTGTITLYARWYSTVTFNVNGATGGTAPAQQTANAGSSITLPSVGNLTRTGYTFGGWNINEYGTGTNRNAGSPYTPEGDITLYARWYSTVTFDINGGSGTTPASQTANAGSSITLPSVGNLTRTGYTFDGWNTNTSGTGTNRNAGSSYTPDGTITLYARWYSTVTFNANGATGGTAPASQTANAGSSITLPAVGNLTRTGYTFGGWNTNSSGTETNYSAGAPYTPTGTITLYAKWLPNTAGITLDVKHIIDGAPIIADITISRTSSGYPATFPVSVNVSDYDPGSINWEVAGVGVYAGQTVTGSGTSFTLNAAEVKYNSLGGHALILTVTKGGQQYQRAIPFTIVH